MAGKYVVLIIALITINLISVHSLQRKFKRELNKIENSESIIITEKIPFYYLEYTHGKFMKIDRETGLMASRATVQKYSNKSNHLGTYFLNLLLICDYDMYKKREPMAFKELQMELWTNVDNNYLKKLTNPKIKLAISGMIYPTREGILPEPNVTNGEKYYISNETLSKVSKWLKDNEGNFEDIKYDAFVYVASSPLKHYDDDRQRYVNDNYMTAPFVCHYKNNKISEATRPPGGIFYYNNDRDKFGINNIYGAHFIADGFGVPYDQDVGCEGGYVMDNWDRNYDSAWSGCSLSAFQKIERNSSYSCLKWTLESIKSDQDYDDS